MILMSGSDGQTIPSAAASNPNNLSPDSRDHHVSTSPSGDGNMAKPEPRIPTSTAELPNVASALSATNVASASTSTASNRLDAALVDVAVRAAIMGLQQMSESENSVVASSSWGATSEQDEDDDDDMSVDQSEFENAELQSPSSSNHVDDKDQTKTKPARRKRGAPQLKPGQSAGRWTPEEHQAFLQGLKIFGREWKKVAEGIPTRTSAQIRSHAQKYFAKVSREETILQLPTFQPPQQQQPQPQPPLLHPPAELVVPVSNSVAAAAAVVALSDHQQQQHPHEVQDLPPSVQANVERILANPEAVQQEVADTLRALRERYRQLQIRLEQQQRQSLQQPDDDANHGLADRIVEEDDEDNNTDGDAEDQSSSYLGPFKPMSPTNRKRRSLEDCDASSVASSISASLASRDLGDEEWIALNVLRGALPRASSSADLTNPHLARSNSGVNNNNNEEDGGGRRSSNSSSPSETTSSSRSKRSREE